MKYGIDAFTKRLQSTVATIRGVAIIEVKIVVAEKEIVSITRPTVTHIEPRNQNNEFIRLLTLGVGPTTSKAPPPTTSDEKIFNATITDGEAEVMDHLVQAWNTFTTLPVIHEWDGVEFQDAIHRAQRVLLARPAMRKIYTLTR